MNNSDTGILLNGNNLKLQRNYFKQMVRLVGIQVIYRAPVDGKTYTGYGDLDTYYCEPIKVGCIFNEHPTQWTMKKLGWNSELQTEVSLISVPYDVDKLQKGSIFIIPSGLDNAEGRIFEVKRMSTTSVYPASITCELVPLWTNTSEKSERDYSKSNFTLLMDDEENN